MQLRSLPLLIETVGVSHSEKAPGCCPPWPVQPITNTKNQQANKKTMISQTADTQLHT